jgi:hypothetical protein
MNVREFREHCFGNEDATVTDQYVAAFFEGAVEFFEEIKDRL